MTLAWDQLDGLSDDDLSLLVAAAIDVLEEGGDADFAVGELPQSALRAELAEGLSATGSAVGEAEAGLIVAEDETARAVALLLLVELGEQSELRAEVERAYEQRKQMMVVDVGLVAAGALLVLVMKLRSVKVEKGKSVDVEFDEFKLDMVAGVKRLLGL